LAFWWRGLIFVYNGDGLWNRFDLEALAIWGAPEDDDRVNSGILSEAVIVWA
jgi:hypothetical protein